MDEDTDVTEVEQTGAMVDRKNQTLVFPDSDLIDQYHEPEAELVVDTVDYDSGGHSELDGSEIIRLIFASQNEEPPYHGMSAYSHLTDEQAQQIALDLLRESGADVRNGTNARGKNGESVKRTYEVTITDE